MLVRNAKLGSHNRYRTPSETLSHHDSVLMRSSSLPTVAQVSLATSLGPLSDELVDSSERRVIRNDARGIGAQKKSANQRVLPQRTSVVQMPKQMLCSRSEGTAGRVAVFHSISRFGA